MYLYWIEFIFAAIFIYLSGKKLSSLANQLADEKGISKGFIGIFLLGAITSFPETTVTISAAGIFQSPDISLGNVYGSNLFNVSMIAALPFMGLKREKIGSDTKNSILLFIILNLISILAIGSRFPYEIFHLNLLSILIFILYILGFFILYKLSKKSKNLIFDEDENMPVTSTSLFITKIMIFAIIIMASGILASHAAKEISKAPFLSESFVSALFLAVATSLPEITITFHLVKINSLNMALGNLFGSNCFNIALVPISDLFYKENIFLKTSGVLLVPIIGSILITVLAIGGIRLTKINKSKKFGFDSLLIIILYLVSIVLINKYSN